MWPLEQRVEVFIEGDNQNVQLRVVGEVVAQTCGDLRMSVMDAVARKPQKIALDLSEVPFMDTSGIGVLVGLRAHMKSKGVVLELANPTSKVKQVLRMTRLLAVFGLPDE
ncbi:MAG: hypothetical protein PWP23_3203 [Candidatus Sumerlaeota bacterium]|nr:hypothetical protein [Candidatus Sumerlaeota bacterium]